MARQERAIETRRKLLVGAAQVFDERGYAGASINEIQERSGVTKGAMYFHFASKEEIARGVMAAQTEVPTELRSQPASPMQQVIDLTHELARRLRTDVLFRASIRLTVERGPSRRMIPHSTTGGFASSPANWPVLRAPANCGRR